MVDTRLQISLAGARANELAYGEIAARPRFTARARDRFSASKWISRENSKMENPVPSEPCSFMMLSSFGFLQTGTTVPIFCLSTDDPVSLRKTRMTGSVLSKAIMPGLARARIAPWSNRSIGCLSKVSAWASSSSSRICLISFTTTTCGKPCSSNVTAANRANASYAEYMTSAPVPGGSFP
jgi:hypothetical protein